MAVIKISEFGGISPSVDPRRLPAEGAQTAENLSLRYGDFRPLKGAGASVATVVTGAISVHRTPSGVWLSSATDTDYVDGQVVASAERVYLTGRSAYPEVWQSSAYRRLGVPAPSAAPTVAAVTTDEFTTDDRSQATQAVKDEILTHAAANRTAYMLGNDTPGSSSVGALWLIHGTQADLPSTGYHQINYAIPLSSTSPLTTTTASDSYLLDAQLQGKLITYSASPYWCIAIPWKGRAYEIDDVALSTDLQTILLPPANTADFFTPTQADDVAARLADVFSITKDPVATYLAAVNAGQVTVVNLLTGTEVDPSRAYALQTAMASLGLSVSRLEDQYTALNASLPARITEILVSYDTKITSATTRELSTRAYIYTYVTDRGEESAPSPASALVTVDQNDTVDVDIGAPSVAAPYGTLSYWRLYRSSTTNVGAEYQLVAEIPIGTLTYNDSLLQEELQEVCPSLTWTEPRSDMFGLVGMPNGIMVGLADNGRTLCFCEPYQPYAWPREYELSLKYPGVGLGVFGQTVVVLTTGFPSYVSGADSANMSEQVIEIPQACVSKRSIVSAEMGVFFASPDGVCLASAAGVSLLTEGAYSKDDWTALGLATSFAAFSEGVYYIVTEN